MAEAEKHSFTSKGGKESSGVHNLYLNFLCLDNIQLNDGNFNNRALRMVLWWICILSLEYGLFFPILGENCVCKVWRLTTNLGKRNLTLWRMMNRVDWLQILNNLYNWKKKKKTSSSWSDFLSNWWWTKPPTPAQDLWERWMASSTFLKGLGPRGTYSWVYEK